ncbi:hypothetical protein BSL78_18746 [Apostichopus japonicus]|uniref:Ig-like domain-containing protein n=1 Tax=Stichopus japonicus TaxID=307972 RepID=A0A2G8K8P7_STIJA|nr:hypothetical protein BSL78_18746 [Apostichopus japonicus]
MAKRQQYRNDPQIRWHGQKRQWYSSGKYDIKDDGSMVIPRVEFSHEGLYTISVLQADGHLLRDSIMVGFQWYICFILFVTTVPLKDLTIHDCFVSDHELCKKISEGESSLVCSAQNTKPPVEISWLSLKESSMPTDYGIKDDTYKFNDTVPLYSTISTLKYDTMLFSLEYFTCIATGIAVRDVSSASTIVKGHHQYDDRTSRVTYLLKGESLPLSCPRPKYPFGLLSATFSNQSSTIIMEWGYTSNHDARVCGIVSSLGMT